MDCFVACAPRNDGEKGVRHGTKTVRTGRHRRAASVQPVLLADADGAGAQGVVGRIDSLVLYREGSDCPAQFGKGAGADRRRNLGRRFLGDRELPGRYLSRPAVAVRRRGRRAMGRMLNWWGDVTVVGGMFPLIVADIPSHL